jgi:histone H3/H4
MMKQTISQLSLKRLCHRVGIKRISVDSYKPLYQYMISVLLDLVDKIKILMKSNKSKIINEQDVEAARILVSLLQNKIQSGGKSTDYPGFCDGLNSQCSNMPEAGQQIIPGAVAENPCASGPPPMNGGGNDKHEHYFTIPLTQFERFVSQYLPHNFSFDFSNDGMDRLQYHIENMTMQYLAYRNEMLQAQNIKQFLMFILLLPMC